MGYCRFRNLADTSFLIMGIAYHSRGVATQDASRRVATRVGELDPFHRSINVKDCIALHIQNLLTDRMAPQAQAEAHSRPRYDSMRSQSSIGQGWARPASPTVSHVPEHTLRRTDILQFSTTTTGSKINLPPSHALITRKDLRASIMCFEEVRHT